MRLIDADKLYLPPEDIVSRMAVANAPTAYDVDKVVEELGEATWQYNPPFNDEPYRMVILSNKAVQIVRRGGME